MIHSNRLLTLCLATVMLWCSAPVHAALNPNGDGTVTDTTTGLIWDQCAYGFTGATCTGSAALKVDWPTALGMAISANALNYKGNNDWRLPNVKELASIVDLSRVNPAIDVTAFPNTPSPLEGTLQNPTAYFWSSTVSTNGAIEAWFVEFKTGFSKWLPLENSLPAYVRLVRGGGQAFDRFDKLAPPAPIPTLSAWGLLLLSLLMAGAVLLGLRRKR
jgi:Protein of unknown function (DUF1566)/IPTL-CTERM motif